MIGPWCSFFCIFHIAPLPLRSPQKLYLHFIYITDYYYYFCVFLFSIFLKLINNFATASSSPNRFKQSFCSDTFYVPLKSVQINKKKKTQAVVTMWTARPLFFFFFSNTIISYIKSQSNLHLHYFFIATKLFFYLNNIFNLYKYERDV